ncbi:protein Star [Agrilus planipennis]|uniref:Protein Star n=1 Tax=Agrilus planipennis TaxID=224129 RepID=A0A1W4X0G6_AGRPL|nr:protein Star [Agrilus planipennis]
MVSSTVKSDTKVSSMAQQGSNSVPSVSSTPGPPPTSTQNMSASPAKVGHIISSPGSLKKLLPIAAFFMAFATVMTILLIYMDNTAMRHHQFRVNMSQDYELLEVAQDNPQLVTYIREVQLVPAVEPHHRPLESTGPQPPSDTAFVLKLLNNKKEGFFVEAGAYGDDKSSKTEYLEKELGWRGLLVQPDPRHYFKLRRHNRGRSQAIHACLSSTPYPKEVTFHQEERDGVKINSIHANSLIDDPDWFNTRVKCFPLYSLLLAVNVTNIDYLSLESGGTELQVLQTIPFSRVKIEVIGVHLLISDIEKDTIKNFLATKNYVFVQNFNNTYIYIVNHLKI